MVFPSPEVDYPEKSISHDEMFIHKPAATYFMMEGARHGCKLSASRRLRMRVAFLLVCSVTFSCADL